MCPIPTLWSQGHPHRQRCRHESGLCYQAVTASSLIGFARYFVVMYIHDFTRRLQAKHMLGSNFNNLVCKLVPYGEEYFSEADEFVLSHKLRTDASHTNYCSAVVSEYLKFLCKQRNKTHVFPCISMSHSCHLQRAASRCGYSYVECHVVTVVFLCRLTVAFHEKYRSCFNRSRLL